jgi:hypothetical protein
MKHSLKLELNPWKNRYYCLIEDEGRMSIFNWNEIYFGKMKLTDLSYLKKLNNPFEILTLKQERGIK